MGGAAQGHGRRPGLPGSGLEQALAPAVRPRRPLKRFTFQRDTALQKALRLTMRHIAATLAVVGAFLFNAGAILADDTSEANKSPVKNPNALDMSGVFAEFACLDLQKN